MVTLFRVFFVREAESVVDRRSPMFEQFDKEVVRFEFLTDSVEEVFRLGLRAVSTDALWVREYVVRSDQIALGSGGESVHDSLDELFSGGALVAKLSRWPLRYWVNSERAGVLSEVGSLPRQLLLAGAVQDESEQDVSDPLSFGSVLTAEVLAKVNLDLPVGVSLSEVGGVLVGEPDDVFSGWEGNVGAHLTRFDIAGLVDEVADLVAVSSGWPWPLCPVSDRPHALEFDSERLLWVCAKDDVRIPFGRFP